VVVALDYLKNCIQTSSNVIKKKIVLISGKNDCISTIKNISIYCGYFFVDLESPSKENHLKTIANSMEKEGVEFSFM